VDEFIDTITRTSIFEVFTVASAAVKQHYEQRGQLTTERALLDDNGDGKGTRADWFRGIRAIRDVKQVPVDLAGSDPAAGFAEMAVRELGAERVVFGSDAVGSGDLISDFKRGEDKIVIEHVAFRIAPGSVLNLVNGAEPLATGAAPQFLFETDNGRLWFDADGAGNAADANHTGTLTHLAAAPAQLRRPGASWPVRATYSV